MAVGGSETKIGETGDMSRPQFEVAHIGNNCYTINDHDRTVAFVTSQGYIDWLLKSPLQKGPKLTSIRKETHLCYVLGLKLLLITPHPGTELKSFSYKTENAGQRLVLHGHGQSRDGKFTSDTTAVLRTDANASRYEWDFETTITNESGEHVQTGGLEYNNIYPGNAGKCMVFANEKEYNCTLMVDRDGVAWRFPHQHQMHYGGKISKIRFDKGSMAGFFGEQTGSPVVILDQSPVEPDWAICDMYYDLHCCARTPQGFAPGQKLVFRYLIKYLGRAESEKWLNASKPVPVDDIDRLRHDMPRLNLGLNSFDRNVSIDSPDEASGFRPAPPKLVWDREQGHATKGSLRITNQAHEQTVWSAAPPTQVPAQHKLSISGMVKTQDVSGEGLFIRVRYHTFVWHPTPHVEWVQTLESAPVAGTTPGWVKVVVPELDIPDEHFDYLIWLDVVLDGKGVAWLTDLDFDLQPSTLERPELEEGSSKSKLASAGRSNSAAGSAT